MAEDLESAAIEIKLRCTKITMQRKTQIFLLLVSSQRFNRLRGRIKEKSIKNDLKILKKFLDL